MASFLKKKKQSASLAAKFDAAVATDTDAQCELFMKSFIFTLGDEWKTVVELSKSFEDSYYFWFYCKHLAILDHSRL